MNTKIFESRGLFRLDRTYGTHNYSTEKSQATYVRVQADEIGALVKNTVKRADD